MTSDLEPEERKIPESNKWETRLNAIASVYIKVILIFLPRAIRDLVMMIFDMVIRAESESQPLEDRARQAADALTKARELVDELETEVKAKLAIVENLASQKKEADQRTEDAIRRASLTEETARAIDAYLDRSVRNRLAELETNAKRREWSLATIVALVIGLIVGVGSILIAHFLFGF